MRRAVSGMRALLETFSGAVDTGSPRTRQGTARWSERRARSDAPRAGDVGPNKHDEIARR